ncbi:MAG: hypothetical protein RLZZ78_346 [Armatimonadota bacterium]|jgi:hypothetical protein
MSKSPTVPLTDPADLMTLLGRFAAGIVMNLFIVWSLTKQNWWSVSLFTVASLIIHRATIGLYRRLRKERAERVALLESQMQSVEN